MKPFRGMWKVLSGNPLPEGAPRLESRTESRAKVVEVPLHLVGSVGRSCCSQSPGEFHPHHGFLRLLK